MGLTLRLLIGLTAVLFALRVYAAATVGWGDSEALYASYSLFPQASYLDHPGLIGVLLSTFGLPPSVLFAHCASAVLATAAPWFAYLCARQIGVTTERAQVLGATFAVTPVLSIGLFAWTPDLPLYFLWMGCLAATERAAQKDETTAAFIGGALAGLSISAKLSGIFLIAGFALHLLHTPKARRSGVLGLLAGLLPFAAIIQREVALGFPMLRHRSAQAGSGLSLRTLGKFFGGELLYVSPILCVLVALGLVRMLRAREPSFLTRVTWFAAPGLALVSILSERAEPHWFVPALLAPALEMARTFQMPRGLSLRAAIGLGAVFTFVTYTWVLWPGAMQWVSAPESNANIARELYGWDDVVRTADGIAKEHEDLTVIAPHWTLCAQLRARLSKDVRVGCETPEGDDFQTWAPTSTWENSRDILLVTDDRFPTPRQDNTRTETWRERVQVFRGGKRIRTFTLRLFSTRVGA